MIEKYKCTSFNSYFFRYKSWYSLNDTSPHTHTSLQPLRSAMYQFEFVEFRFFYYVIFFINFVVFTAVVLLHINWMQAYSPIVQFVLKILIGSNCQLSGKDQSVKRTLGMLSLSLFLINHHNITEILLKVALSTLT